MNKSIWKTETCDNSSSSNSPIKKMGVAATMIPILIFVSSMGNVIQADRPAADSIVTTDSYEQLCSRLSKGGISIYSNSSNYMNIPNSIKKLNDISSLPDNWDGDGATSFASSIIENAKQLIDTLSVQPDIFPTSRNSIQFEYENDKKEYLEFELFDKDHINCYFNDHKGCSIKRETKMAEVNSIVCNFYE